MLGRVESVFWRYPVKSMRGEEVDEIFVAFTGLMGDRVYAISSTAAPKSFPWHTAREQEDLVLYRARFKERSGTLKPDNMEEAMGHPANVHAPFPEADAFAVEVERPDGSVVDIADPAFLAGIRDRSKGDLSLRFTSAASSIAGRSRSSRCRPWANSQTRPESTSTSSSSAPTSTSTGPTRAASTRTSWWAAGSRSAMRWS